MAQNRTATNLLIPRWWCEIVFYWLDYISMNNSKAHLFYKNHTHTHTNPKWFYKKPQMSTEELCKNVR